MEQIDPSGAVSFFHHDQLGSTRALTSTTGAVVATFAFDAYGKPTSTTGSVTTPFGFAGEYTDAETGFVYLRARYYDPATGQFLSRDPIEALTRSAYGYVDGNPLNGRDPLGLKPMWQKIKGGLDVAAVVLSGGALIADMVPGGQLVGAVLGGASAAVSLSAAGLQCAAGGLNAECAKSAAIGLLSAATFGTSLAASKYLEELPEAEKAARMAFRSLQYTVDAIGYLISGGTTQWGDLAGGATIQTVAFSTACP